MELKRNVQYRIPFLSKSVTWCCAMMGLSVFLRFWFYFMPYDPLAVNAGVWILRIILPTLFCISFGILLRIVHLRVPGIYGILAALLCMLLMLWDILDGSILEIVLSVISMLALGVSLLATTGGYIPTRSISCLLLLLSIFLRFFLGNDSLTFRLWLDKISELSILLSLLFFTVSLKAYSE